MQNKNYFTSNTDTHDINTRYDYNLYLPSTNLSIVQKGVLFSGSKIYNHLPTYLLTELSSSWEAANCAATQELTSILRNAKVHYRIHMTPLVTALSTPAILTLNAQPSAHYTTQTGSTRTL
jgi:hypothetical protein